VVNQWSGRAIERWSSRKLAGDVGDRPPGRAHLALTLAVALLVVVIVAVRLVIALK
jgi:hypothetical protein